MTANSMRDDGEDIGLMTPMVISTDSRYFGELDELAFDLCKRSTQFTSTVPRAMQNALGDAVRIMNCYYSNLIEGHNTLPIDIESALQAKLHSEPKKRDLQLEAKAHIAVQSWIDSGALTGKAFSIDTLTEIHRRFCNELPAGLLWVTSPSGQRERVEPGQLRTGLVVVGKHVAITPGAVPRFLKYYSKEYSALSAKAAVLACAAAHHRLLWIHPFADGNGRAARLVSHAVLLEHLDTKALWSISRALARHVDDYKTHLQQCDQKRWDNYDGRGLRSERALAEFTKFFLQQCIDQVNFMSSLVQSDRLMIRIMRWADEEISVGALPPRADDVLRLVLESHQGLLPGDIPQLLGISDRHARRIVAALKGVGVLTHDSQRTPFRLSFSVKIAEVWLPALFPTA